MSYSLETALGVSSPNQVKDGFLGTLDGMWREFRPIEPLIRNYTYIVDDFHFFNDPGADATLRWVRTTTEAGAGGNLAAIMVAKQNGVLQLKTDTFDNDAEFITTVSEGFQFAENKKLFFEAEFSITTLTSNETLIGLWDVEQETDPVDDLPVDGVYFNNVGLVSRLDIIVRDTDATVSTNTVKSTMVAGTKYKVGYYWDGRGSLEYYLDDVLLNTLDAEVPTDAGVGIGFGIQNSSAASRDMEIDSILCFKER